MAMPVVLFLLFLSLSFSLSFGSPLSLFLYVLDFGFVVFLVLFGFNLRYGSPLSLFISVLALGLWCFWCYLVSILDEIWVCGIFGFICII